MFEELRRSFSWRRIDRFLVSLRGSQYVYMAVNSAIVGIGMIKVSGNSLFAGFLSEVFYQLKQDHKKIRMPDWLSDITLEEFEKSRMRKSLFGSKPTAFFYFTDFSEPVSRGSSGSFTSNHIGLPYYFKFRTLDEIKPLAEKITVGFGNRGQKLFLDALRPEIMDTLLLSENAKRFIIQRELQRGRSLNYLVGEPLCFVGNCAIGAALAKGLNQQFNLISMPRSVRLVAYSAIFSLVMFSYGQQRNWLSANVDWKVDKSAGKYGFKYINGGIEYYEKLLRKHRIVREFLDSDRYYTEIGDYRQFFGPWRRPPTSILTRLKRLKSLLEDYKRDFGEEED